MPSIKSGRSTDGNMCRRLLQNVDKFSKITGLDLLFLKNIKMLLACVCSSQSICSLKFLDMAECIYDFYCKNYAHRANITPTVHRLLNHGHHYFEFFIFPTGVLAEQSIELSHKFFKQFKKHAFCKSRMNILLDTAHHLHIITYPTISKTLLQIYPPSDSKFCDETDLHFFT